MKRALDLFGAGLGLFLFSPVIAIIAFLIYIQDFSSPFFVSQRVGRKSKLFGMVKFRSMIVNAHKRGAQSTAGDDRRITPVGSFIRRYKLDELPQLWNILKGEMSLVGPRPNVPSEVALYSEEERGLLSARPGITDFASIVFADEGEILRGSKNPDRDYNLLIRPWKNRLGLHYIRCHSVTLDLRLIAITGMAIVTRSAALAAVGKTLEQTGASPELIEVALRTHHLVPTLPVGVTEDTWEQHLRTVEATEGYGGLIT